MFAKIDDNLSDINNIRDEFVINQMQFDRILKQYSRKFIELDKLSINKDFIEDFNVDKQYCFDIVFIEEQIDLI